MKINQIPEIKQIPIKVMNLTENSLGFAKHYPEDSEGENGLANEIVGYFVHLMVALVAADGDLDEGEAETIAKYFDQGEYDEDNFFNTFDGVMSMVENSLADARVTVSKVPFFFRVICNHDRSENSNNSQQAFDLIKSFIEMVLMSDGSIDQSERSLFQEIKSSYMDFAKSEGIVID